MEIKENTNLAEILGNSKLVKVLEKYNLPCLSCPFAKIEFQDLTIGRVCALYDIDLEKLLKELNRALKK